ncbi:MAG TPA: pitrilysin family protein [Allosphingosinicella sp.]|nr:pitrilysin family protein [Allosphingosinicella sp.]
MRFTAMKAALLAVTAAAAIAGTGAAPAAAPAAASRIEVPPLQFKERRLANGLRVISMRDTTTANVSVSVWYEVGSKHDPEGRSGFAHLFEHILSRKTRNMPYNMINRLVEDVGGERNASTSSDRTNYYESVPARYLETMLWTHAERMARPVVDPQVFETERNVVKEEYRQGVLTPPYGRLRLLVTENAWDVTPHRRPTIGSIEQLDAATVEDARAFHEAYYGPDTATLIVSGNFDQKQLDSWVDKYLGPIPARASRMPLAIAAREPKRTRPRTATMYAPNVPLPVVGSVWRIPGMAHRDMAAIEVLDGILTTGESSRLHKSLVREKRIATEAGAQLAPFEEEGYWAPNVILAGGRTVEEAEAALAAEIERVRNSPVTAAELAEAKNELLAQALRQRETFSGRASGLGEVLVRSGDPRQWDKLIAAYQRVTAADVQRVARTYFTPASRVDLRYLNESARPAGQVDGWTNPVPMPRFKSVPPATRPPNELAAEGEREQPPAPGPSVRVTPPAISETRLPTGLTVVTARSGQVPLATMTLVVKGGASTDPRGKAGLATMAADLATKGTASRSAERISAELEALGATLNTGAGADGSFLSITAPVANLEAAGRVLADIAQNAAFPAGELELQRKQAIDSLSIALRNPGQLASMVALPLVYGSAPYATLGNGTPRSLASLSRADFLEQHRKWWHPGNSALVISGGIDLARADALAASLFGNWRGEGPAPIPPAQRAGQAQKVRTVVIDLPGAGQAAVLAAVRGISRGDPLYYQANAANAVLGGGSSGRLFQEVRTKRALSYGAYSGMPARLDAGLLTASGQTKNETAAEVAKVFLDELDRLGKQPLERQEVANRIAFITGAFNRQAETSGGLGAMLANLLQQGMSPAEVARFVANMEAVTPEGASSAAARLVGADRATLVIVGDAAKFIDKLRAVRPDVEVIRFDELDLDSPTLRKAG